MFIELIFLFFYFTVAYKILKSLKMICSKIKLPHEYFLENY